MSINRGSTIRRHYFERRVSLVSRHRGRLPRLSELETFRLIF